MMQRRSARMKRVVCIAAVWSAVLFSCARDAWATNDRTPVAAGLREGVHQASPDAAETADAAPVVLPGAYQFALQAAGPDALPYRIMVSPPTEPADERGHPVLYVLDGNATFASFHEARRMQSKLYGKAIIVAVGYPTDEPLDFKRRSHDFSPQPAASQHAKPASSGSHTRPLLGGDGAFTAFLRDVLMPEIARRHPVDPAQQSVFGHSFGGMYALHVLFTAPSLFTHYVAVSPSLWWQDRYLIAEEQHFTAQVKDGTFKPVRHSVLVLAGGAETPQTLQDAQAQAVRLQALSGFGLRTHYAALPDETHISVPTAAIAMVLRQVFSARQR
ncbi:alpha/beta hydrolase [Schauerella aestuarii]|uniref:alpha/beta hydrolase n=1 Tax=Schauerella aestuarii TaxID=2511204 RepID=UPI0013693FF5|nr:alpha/beta hydrolase-fold protein [Achromobacter aestuarii]MYZ45819.1 alpha/beta hydrolase [Achromobacter aestuarii]